MSKAKPKFYHKNIGSKGTRMPIYTVIAKEWWDRINGNSYVSARIYKDGEEVAKLPMTYGYGNYYLQMAMEWAKEYFSDLTGKERDTEIFAMYNKQERCLKREVVAWGGERN